MSTCVFGILVLNVKKCFNAKEYLYVYVKFPDVFGVDSFTVCFIKIMASLCFHITEGVSMCC